MSASRQPVLSAIGVPAAAQQTYERVLGLSGSPVEVIAGVLDVPVGAALRELAPLAACGAVVVQGDLVVVRTPSEVVHHLLAGWVRDHAGEQQRLEALTGAMGALNASTSRPDARAQDVVGALDGEVSRGGNPVALLKDLIERSTGDLLWFRPDQFRRPREDAMAEIVGAAVRGGRSSRALYPARALHEAPDTLRRRAEVGEEIRIVADLPTRMIVIGGTHAVLPEPLGRVDEPRLLVRQLSVVQACSLLFDAYWDRALPAPGLERGVARPDLRRFVVQQLAAGVQDEQIARALGVSLRTVRRRIADMMVELGADSRFQAGVEAARRGWL
ncbi:helix-turn-helix domain-containing protein [Nocardioides sp. CFH 31398]|uniref:helix-turn-helix domain-containing protein n=1 Tax=Nocardioides sp. CFH 31398 TaxID=2919579 RepID=UPI001F06E488|nr:helix-turn-helix domain-containing protein [Nocardioides sp. CFH 31398]MCH1865093.1 LuxR C-terminal-related transcriptional regulator [Nocardioides sp. CFH 31398]